MTRDAWWVNEGHDVSCDKVPSGGLAERAVEHSVACGAPPAGDLPRFITMARAKGWDVCVVVTPAGARWIDRPALQEQTGYVVREDYKAPGDQDTLPPAEAIIVAPATFNTINKWAAGISDTLALGLITEAIGRDLPLVALPFLNRAQAQHPAFERSVAALRDAGVDVLYGPDVFELHEPGTGSGRVSEFPWHLTLKALRAPNSR